MKHIEELKIGATAITFCLIMLLVYAVFPQDGFVPATKAPMPEIPSAEEWNEEEDYGFQIYSEETNYDDSYSESLPDTTENISDPTETPSGDTGSADTSVPEQTDPVSGDTQDPGSESLPAEEDTGSDPSYAVEPSVDESYDPEAEGDIYEEDTYEEEDQGEEIYQNGAHQGDFHQDDPHQGDSHQGNSHQDEFHWNETEATYHFE